MELTIRKKKAQESEDERLARLDKRIERARVIHELTHLWNGNHFSRVLIVKHN